MATDVFWLGIDVGTSSVKALLIGADGAVHGRARVPYAHGPQNGEQDAREYVDAARLAVAQCGATERAVGGIGVVGQTPTLVLVDEAGAPVRPALTWQDTRAELEARELASELGPAGEVLGLDLPWTAAFPPAKLLWLARHEPETLRRTRRLLQPKDVVGLALTGVAVSDPWSSKGLVHLRDLEPAEALLRRVGWTSDAVPPVAPAWTRAGDVTAAARNVFGLREGTPVAVGWSDALAGMLALGVFDAATAFVHSGTSSIVGCSLDGGTVTTESSSLMTIPAACAPLRVVYGPTQSSGASIGWLARVLGHSESDVLDLAGTASDGTATFVPYLAGERAPIWRSDVRGALLGLSLDDGPAELARAVVDGICLSEAHVLAAAEAQVGAQSAEVRVAGRGASLSPWLPARLRTLGRPLLVLDEPDVSALGAAMLAAAAAHDGDLAAARSVAARLVPYEPDGPATQNAAALRERYFAASAVCADWGVAGPTVRPSSASTIDG